MKNIEKYTNTKDALEAWKKSRWNHKGLFADWLNYEYEAPRVPTLLEAANDAATEWLLEGVSTDKMSALLDAVIREKCKPVRNCDRYRTFEEAKAAFLSACQRHCCGDCPFGTMTNPSTCAIKWLYTEDDKEAL